MAQHHGGQSSNGNLHLVLGSGSCVTCGGGGNLGAYPNPQNTKLTGPVLVYNTLGMVDTDLGPKWMLPWNAYVDSTASEGTVFLYDADGTRRFWDEGDSSDWVSAIEDATLTDDATYWIVTRLGGDVWKFYKSGSSANKLHTITSRTGHEITCARDANGRVTSVTDGFGRVTSFFYITYGSSITRLNEIREPAPGDVGWQSTFLQYDSSGRLTQITNPMGETTRFEHDGSNRISTAYDGHGHGSIYTYDGSSRVTNIEDPNGNDTVIAYTSSTVRTVTNRLAKVTEYTLDGSGRIVKVKDAMNNETEFAWDSTTWELSSTLGPKIPVSGTPWTRHKTILTYGVTDATKHELAKQELKKITDSDLTGTLLAKDEWTYNTQHDVLTHKNPLDKTTTTTYKNDGGGNSVGLVLTVVNPLSQTVLTNTYDTSANKYRHLTSVNGVGKTTTFAYNQNTANSYGAPDKITAPSGAITNLKIDVRGRAYEVTGPSGNTDKFEFDALDRTIRHTNPDGTASETVYDCCHLMGEVDENGRGTQSEYDKMGLLAKTIDPSGEETTYGYNAEGWQTSMVNPRGKTTTTSYDDIGRVLQIDHPGGWQEIFTYFEPGMVKTKKNKKGTDEDKATYTYDDLYNLKKKGFPSGTDTEFETDAHGRPTKMKDASGEKRFYYDDADRLTKAEQGPTGFVVGTDQNYVLENSWNAASQRTQAKVTIRTLSAKTWDSAYTDDGYLDTLTNPDGDVTDHDYLTDGRVKKITLKSNTSTKKSTRETFYQDTDASHAYVAGKNKHLRRTLDKQQAGTVITQFDYELDASGNRLSMTDKDSKYWAYGYDPKQQLKSETKWTAKTPGTRDYQNAFLYDPNGNRLFLHADGVATAYTYGDNDEMTAAGSDTFTYDHFGNTKTKVSGGNTTTYGWDFESHLLSIDYPGTSADDTHEYDGHGQRMRSKLAGASNWTNFIHDELTGNLLVEYTLISGTFTIRSENTWGLGLISTNREGTKRYFHFDGLGSTWALTDYDEAVTDTYSYSAFGTTTTQDSANGPAVIPFMYVGRWGYYDDGARGAASAFCLLGLRYVDFSSGRFLTWDPLLIGVPYYSPGFGKLVSLDPVEAANLYMYAANRPSVLVDPLGLRQQIQHPILKAGKGLFDCARCASAAIERLLKCGSCCYDLECIEKHYPRCNYNSVCCRLACEKDFRNDFGDPTAAECIKKCFSVWLKAFKATRR